MDIKKIIFGITILFFITGSGQTKKKLDFNSLKIELIDFLLNKNEINLERSNKLKSGEFTFNLSGVYNNLSKGILKNGMYSFSSFGSHTKGYFVIVSDNNFKILDISSRQGLDESIKNTLDFCEQNKYCVTITNDYISKVIGVFYSLNKNPLAGIDVNCEKGISNKKKLP